MTYEAKKQARIERYLNRAEKAEVEASASFGSADRIASFIPMGQPILLGHHSEKRHRRDLAKIDNGMRKGIAAQEKAAYWKSRAEAAEANHTISSDDPNALDRLRDKLASLEAMQEMFKEVNRAHRAWVKNPETDLSHLSEKTQNLIRNYTPRYSWEPSPIAPYEMTNNNANIKRVKDRITQLEATQGVETTEKEVNGIKIVENVEENRIQLVFAGKPEESIRKTLKSNGFRWSPTNGAWQRQLNNAGRYAAENALRIINA